MVTEWYTCIAFHEWYTCITVTKWYTRITVTEWYTCIMVTEWYACTTSVDPPAEPPVNFMALGFLRCVSSGTTPSPSCYTESIVPRPTASFLEQGRVHHHMLWSGQYKIADAVTGKVCTQMHREADTDMQTCHCYNAPMLWRRNITGSARVPSGRMYLEACYPGSLSLLAA